jgi:hypothetical protein
MIPNAISDNRPSANARPVMSDYLLNEIDMRCRHPYFLEGTCLVAHTYSRDTCKFSEGHPECPFHAGQIKLIFNFVSRLELKNDRHLKPSGPQLLLLRATFDAAEAISAPFGARDPIGQWLPPAARIYVFSELFEGDNVVLKLIVSAHV